MEKSPYGGRNLPRSGRISPPRVRCGGNPPLAAGQNHTGLFSASAPGKRSQAVTGHDLGVRPRFHDRTDAGRVLAAQVAEEVPSDLLGEDPLVLALPRGGVPVAAEVASALGAPLDVFVVRKLRTPGHEELAMGAVASGGSLVLNQRVVQAAGVSAGGLRAAIATERAELERQETRYRGARLPADMRDRTVVLVDDGLATGSTMRAAVRAARERGAGRIIVAVPTGAPETCAALVGEVDVLICPEQLRRFSSVGGSYADFGQVADDEVRALLPP